MKPVASKIRAALAVSLLFTNVLFAHQVEKSIWEERKVAMVISSSRQFVAPAKAGAQVVNLALKMVESLGPGFRRGDGKPTILHIQDVHMNAEAQESIRATVADLLRQKRVALVGLEGAFGPLDLSRFQSYDDQDSIRVAADFLLKENSISGAVHAGLTSGPQTTHFVGVDDPVHYQANVDAYKNSIGQVKEAKARLSVAQGELEGEKKKIYSAPLLAFDGEMEKYRSGGLGFGDYVRRLSNETNEVPTSVALFLNALDKEGRLDFSRIESERAELLHSLTPRLSPGDSSTLLDWSRLYRLGNLTPAEFYGRVSDLCRQKGIPLSRFPAMSAYLDYLAVADRLDARAILSATTQMESAAYAALARTEPERRLVAESRRLYLTGKLLEFALTREEWNEYQMIPLPTLPTVRRGEEFLPMFHNGSKSFPPMFHNGGARGGVLLPFEAFYREAEIRDRKMAENLLSAMKKNHATTAILVTGGFHSTGIAEQMKQAGIATITVAPKITKVETASGTSYLSVFAQQKTPLEKLFEGEKLFVSPIVMDRSREVHMGFLTVLRRIWLSLGRIAKGRLTEDVRRLTETRLNVSDFTFERGEVSITAGDLTLAAETDPATGRFQSEVQRMSAMSVWKRQAIRIIKTFQELPHTLLSLFSRAYGLRFIRLRHKFRSLDERIKRLVGLRGIRIATWAGAIVGGLLGSGAGAILGFFIAHLLVHYSQMNLFPEAPLMADDSPEGLLRRMVEDHDRWTDEYIRSLIGSEEPKVIAELIMGACEKMERFARQEFLLKALGYPEIAPVLVKHMLELLAKHRLWNRDMESNRYVQLMQIFIDHLSRSSTPGAGQKLEGNTEQFLHAWMDSYRGNWPTIEAEYNDQNIEASNAGAQFVRLVDTGGYWGVRYWDGIGNQILRHSVGHAVIEKPSSEKMLTLISLWSPPLYNREKPLRRVAFVDFKLDNGEIGQATIRLDSDTNAQVKTLIDNIASRNVRLMEYTLSGPNRYFTFADVSSLAQIFVNRGEDRNIAACILGDQSMFDGDFSSYVTPDGVVHIWKDAQVGRSWVHRWRLGRKEAPAAAPAPETKSAPGLFPANNSNILPAEHKVDTLEKGLFPKAKDVFDGLPEAIREKVGDALRLLPLVHLRFDPYDFSLVPIYPVLCNFLTPFDLSVGADALAKYVLGLEPDECRQVIEVVNRLVIPANPYNIQYLAEQIVKRFGRGPLEGPEENKLQARQLVDLLGYLKKWTGSAYIDSQIIPQLIHYPAEVLQVLVSDVAFSLRRPSGLIQASKIPEEKRQAITERLQEYFSPSEMDGIMGTIEVWTGELNWNEGRLLTYENDPHVFYFTGPSKIHPHIQLFYRIAVLGEDGYEPADTIDEAIQKIEKERARNDGIHFSSLVKIPSRITNEFLPTRGLPFGHTKHLGFLRSNFIGSVAYVDMSDREEKRVLPDLSADSLQNTAKTDRSGDPIGPASIPQYPTIQTPPEPEKTQLDELLKDPPSYFHPERGEERSWNFDGAKFPAPVFPPGGKQLLIQAFKGNKNGGRVYRPIYSRNPKTGVMTLSPDEIERRTTLPDGRIADVTLVKSAPSFSPDGNEVIMKALIYDPEDPVDLADVDNAVEITPQWGFIAFKRDPESGILSAPRQILREYTDMYSIDDNTPMPVYTPDGKYLVVTRKKTKVRKEISDLLISHLVEVFSRYPTSDDWMPEPIRVIEDWSNVEPGKSWHQTDWHPSPVFSSGKTHLVVKTIPRDIVWAPAYWIFKAIRWGSLGASDSWTGIFPRTNITAGEEWFVDKDTPMLVFTPDKKHVLVKARFSKPGADGRPRYAIVAFEWDEEAGQVVGQSRIVIPSEGRTTAGERWSLDANTPPPAISPDGKQLLLIPLVAVDGKFVHKLLGWGMGFGKKKSAAASFLPDNETYTRCFAFVESMWLVGLITGGGILGLRHVLGPQFGPIAIFSVGFFLAGLLIAALFVTLHFVIDALRGHNFDRDGPMMFAGAALMHTLGLVAANSFPIFDAFPDYFLYHSLVHLIWNNLFLSYSLSLVPASPSLYLTLQSLKLPKDLKKKLFKAGLGDLRRLARHSRAYLISEFQITDKEADQIEKALNAIGMRSGMTPAELEALAKEKNIAPPHPMLMSPLPRLNLTAEALRFFEKFFVAVLGQLALLPEPELGRRSEKLRTVLDEVNRKMGLFGLAMGSSEEALRRCAATLPETFLPWLTLYASLADLDLPEKLLKKLQRRGVGAIGQAALAIEYILRHRGNEEDRLTRGEIKILRRELRRIGLALGRGPGHLDMWSDERGTASAHLVLMDEFSGYMGFDSDTRQLLHQSGIFTVGQLARTPEVDVRSARLKLGWRKTRLNLALWHMRVALKRKGLRFGMLEEELALWERTWYPFQLISLYSPLHELDWGPAGDDLLYLLHMKRNIANVRQLAGLSRDDELFQDRPDWEALVSSVLDVFDLRLGMSDAELTRWARERDKVPPHPFLDQRLDRFPFSPRARQLIYELDLYTAGELMRTPADMFAHVPGFGAVSRQQFLDVLKEKGVPIGQSERDMIRLIQKQSDSSSAPAAAPISLALSVLQIVGPIDENLRIEDIFTPLARAIKENEVTPAQLQEAALHVVPLNDAMSEAEIARRVARSMGGTTVFILPKGSAHAGKVEEWIRGRTGVYLKVDTTGVFSAPGKVRLAGLEQLLDQEGFLSATTSIGLHLSGFSRDYTGLSDRSRLLAAIVEITEGTFSFVGLASFDAVQRLVKSGA